MVRMESAFRGERVLVTGATGFIGRQVCLRLLELGGRVRALARDPRRATDLAAAGADIALGDMQDGASLRRAVEGCGWVFHFAGVLGSELRPMAYFRDVNVEGTRRLALASLEVGVERFVHASTIWAYGLDARGEVTESCPLRLSGAPYADTKRESELMVRELVRDRGLPAVVVQPSVVYGPRDEAWTVGTLRLMRAGRMILPDGGRGLVTPIYIDDLVEGVLVVAERGAIGGSYILAGRETLPFGEFFGYLGRMVGRDRLPSVPRGLALAGASALELVARMTGRQPLFRAEPVRGTAMLVRYDGAKAYALGFEPRIGVDAGMRRVAEWLAGEGRAYLEAGRSV
jgi:nucleoside-diphosphate-sugar epimerase